MNAGRKDHDPPGPVVSGMARKGQSWAPSSQSMTCFQEITQLGDTVGRPAGSKHGGGVAGDVMFSHESKNVIGVNPGGLWGFFSCNPGGGVGLGYLRCCLAASGQAGLPSLGWGLGATARPQGSSEVNTPMSTARRGQWPLPKGWFRGHSSPFVARQVLI